MLPHFFDHYAWCDEIHVWDNCSDDGSQEYIQKRGGKLLHYNTGGVLRDDCHADIKNAYRPYHGAWYICVDIDEFVWHPQGAERFRWILDRIQVPPLVSGFH